MEPDTEETTVQVTDTERLPEAEPVMVSATVKTTILAALAFVVSFGVWTPSPDQVVAILGVAGVLEFVAARIVRRFVTPNGRVVVSKADIADAWRADEDDEDPPLWTVI